MNREKITRDYKVGFADMQSSLRTLLSGDNRYLPSWSPDGRRVCVTTSEQNILASLFRVAYPKVMDITISEQGSITIDCVSTAWLDWFGAKKLVEKFIASLEQELKKKDII